MAGKSAKNNNSIAIEVTHGNHDDGQTTLYTEPENIEQHSNDNTSEEEEGKITDNNTSTSITANGSERSMDDAYPMVDQDRLTIAVDPSDDDLDKDRPTKSSTKSKSKSTREAKDANDIDMLKGKYGGARPKSVTKIKNKQANDERITKTPHKKSVASRLLSLHSPTIITLKSNRDKNKEKNNLTNDDIFISETKKAEAELEAARKRLLQSQREAELAKTRREAEEIRKKTLQTQKQADRDNKKAEQEHNRYQKITHQNKPVKSTLETVSFNENIQENESNNERMVRQSKTKARKLNPLRRARLNYTGTDGSNNPNITGCDNGANAWLDAQLNGEELDEEVKYLTNYAKKNSDRNRCYDIDDIPIKGPPTNEDDDIQSFISVTEAAETANALLIDDDLYICRNTGMMRRRQESKERDKSPRKTRRQPASTISRPERVLQERPRGDAYKHHTNKTRKPRENWQYDYYRYDHTEESKWDTESDTESDDIPPDNKKKTHKAKNKNVNDSRNYRRDDYNLGNRSRDDRKHSLPGYEKRRREQQRAAERNDRRQNNRGRLHYSSSESDNMHSNRKIKSGINAKPNSAVVEQKRYPQFSLGQVSGFVGQDIPFGSLTYEQFIAGELTTIINCDDPVKAQGRTEILQRVSLWRMRANVTWAQVRGTYSYIVRCIENQEIDWEADWDRFERHIYEKIVIPNISSTSSQNTQPTRRPSRTASSSSGDIVWFCKQYQRAESCQKESPHSGRIGNSFKQVHHICAACWLKDRVRRPHPESSAECPQRDN